MRSWRICRWRATSPPAGMRARMLEIPPAELAIAVHRGTFADLDRTYAALGTYVAEREIGVEADPGALPGQRVRHRR